MSVISFSVDLPATNLICGKIIEGEILIRIRPTTLLEIFSQFVFNQKVIFKSIIDPDDTCH